MRNFIWNFLATRDLQNRLCLRLIRSLKCLQADDVGGARKKKFQIYFNDVISNLSNFTTLLSTTSICLMDARCEKYFFFLFVNYELKHPNISNSLIIYENFAMVINEREKKVHNPTKISSNYLPRHLVRDSASSSHSQDSRHRLHEFAQ